MSRTFHHPFGSKAKRNCHAGRVYRHEERRPIPPRHVAIEEQLAAMLDENEPAKVSTETFDLPDVEPLTWRPFATSETYSDYWDDDDLRDVELDRLVSDERIPGDWMPNLTDVSFDDGYSFHTVKTPKFDSPYSLIDQPKHDVLPTMRVHEIAKVCGLSPSEVVRDLRLSGEYVANVQSTVVEPVFRDYITRHTDPVWQSLLAENTRFFTEV